MANATLCIGLIEKATTLRSVEFLVDNHPQAIAMLVPKNSDVERIKMLLEMGIEEGNGYQAYFKSTWFPITRGLTKVAAKRALMMKIETFPQEQLADYYLVVKGHCQSIEDNFTWPLPEDFDQAVLQEKRVQELMKIG